MEAHEDIELIVGLLGYTFRFPLLFGFITIGSCKYLLSVYRIEYRTKQKFCLIRRKNK